jgi:hypothetical protein
MTDQDFSIFELPGNNTALNKWIENYGHEILCEVVVDRVM